MWISGLRTATPVSYTHLDVYKRQVLDKVNASGVGPQGLGGTVTALSCAIEPFGTHIAGLPCVVNISCHVTRHAEGEL